jgi:hypothetical protein
MLGGAAFICTALVLWQQNLAKQVCMEAYNLRAIYLPTCDTLVLLPKENKQFSDLKQQAVQALLLRGESPKEESNQLAYQEPDGSPTMNSLLDESLNGGALPPSGSQEPRTIYPHRRPK